MDEKPTVLVIDDEKELSDLLKDGLEMSGVSTLQAFNGEEGLRVALEKKPYLILLDMYMPVMNGIDFLKELRKDEEYGSKARVIVLSNMPDKEKIDETANLKAIDYIVKSNWGVMEIVDKVKIIVSP